MKVGDKGLELRWPNSSLEFSEGLMLKIILQDYWMYSGNCYVKRSSDLNCLRSKNKSDIMMDSGAHLFHARKEAIGDYKFILVLDIHNYFHHHEGL